MLARLGEHSGVTAKTFRNIAPSRARRSMLGVREKGCPAAPKSSRRRSSTTTSSTFGRSCARTLATHARRDSASTIERNQTCLMARMLSQFLVLPPEGGKPRSLAKGRPRKRYVGGLGVGSRLLFPAQAQRDIRREGGRLQGADAAAVNPEPRERPFPASGPLIRPATRRPRDRAARPPSRSDRRQFRAGRWRSPRPRSTSARAVTPGRNGTSSTTVVSGTIRVKSKPG